MNNEEKLKTFLEQNNGYITTSEFISLGLGRHLIQKFLDNGLIKKVDHGIYMDYSLQEDTYYIFQKKNPYVVFSFDTAFYILNLTDKIPNELDITIPSGKSIKGKYNVHNVAPNFYDIGIMTVKSPLGNPIRVYDAERCICDMIKVKNELDQELQNRLIDYYFHNKEKNFDRLLEYAKIFGIDKKVNNIVELMMKRKE